MVGSGWLGMPGKKGGWGCRERCTGMPGELVRGPAGRRRARPGSHATQKKNFTKSAKGSGAVKKVAHFVWENARHTDRPHSKPRP